MTPLEVVLITAAFAIAVLTVGLVAIALVIAGAQLEKVEARHRSVPARFTPVPLELIAVCPAPVMARAHVAVVADWTLGK